MTQKANIVPIKDAPGRIPFAEKTLRNWKSQGVYPQLFIKVSGKVFIDLDEFDKIIQAEKDRATKNAKRYGAI